MRTFVTKTSQNKMLSDSRLHNQLHLLRIRLKIIPYNFAKISSKMGGHLYEARTAITIGWFSCFCHITKTISNEHFIETFEILSSGLRKVGFVQLSPVYTEQSVKKNFYFIVMTIFALSHYRRHLQWAPSGKDVNISSHFLEYWR